MNQKRRILLVDDEPDFVAIVQDLLEGEGFEVECASCHDPHGVPSTGEGSTLLPSFLRVRNENSAVCLTCHTK